jgi:hypothetical protein
MWTVLDEARIIIGTGIDIYQAIKVEEMYQEVMGGSTTIEGSYRSEINYDYKK